MIPSTKYPDPLMQKKNKIKILFPKIINANTIATTYLLPYKLIYLLPKHKHDQEQGLLQQDSKITHHHLLQDNH